MADNNNITEKIKITCNEDEDDSSALDDSSGGPKWMCDYCTYENYPSAIKCVMCKGQKPSLDIFRLNSKNLASSQHILCDSEQQLFLNNNNTNNNDTDIGTVANTSAQRRRLGLCSSQSELAATAAGDVKPRDSSETATGMTTDGKWPCAVCTYLNWPIALRCTQCLTERDKSSSPLLDATNAEEDLLTAAAEYLQRTLTIRSSPPTDGSGGGGGGAVSRKKLSATVTATKTGEDSSYPPTAAPATCYSAMKWQCPECTYENFPKSQKCSMCGSARKSGGGDNSPARESPSKMIVAGGGGGNVTPIIECGEKKQMLHNNNLNTYNSETNATGIIYGGGGASPPPTHTNSLARKKQQSQPQHKENNNNNNNSEERQLLRKLRKHGDWRWLHACLGVVEDNFAAVEEYLSYGGSPGRALTQAEVSLLNRNSAFDVGFTLIHLAIRFQREDMLPMMLSQISGTGSGIKRVPSYVAPDLAADIRRQFSALLRVSRKGQFNCHYVKEHATFALPSEIEDLPVAVQEQLYEELLDKDAQKQLENPPPVLNWSLEITVRLGSRLVVLWNRSAGDCLLDSTMQATWGIFDRDNVLRRALADSLHQCGHLFYPRWKEYEMIQASLMHFQLEEAQWQNDWANLLALASQPGAALEQLHIFALAHIFRRPIVVYGVKFVKSFRGEDIGLARFEGVYLPLLWEPSFCTRSPIALGYTRGHFSALVPTESYSSRLEASNEEEDVTFLPLMDCDMKLLPIHFINETEMGREESLMRQWLDVCMTEGGLMVAQQKLNRPLLVAQMVEEWLNYYRRVSQVFSAPFARRPQQLTGYSSDGDTEED